MTTLYFVSLSTDKTVKIYQTPHQNLQSIISFHFKMIRKPTIECVNVGIDIFPVAPPPTKIKPIIPDKLLLILRKYKYNWRLSQLAKPKYRNKKFIPKIVEPIRGKKSELVKLMANTRFYADQISRPLVR